MENIYCVLCFHFIIIIIIMILINCAINSCECA